MDREALDQAADLLRREIDNENDRLVDLTASQDEADEVTDPLYAAINLLHTTAIQEV